MQRVELNNFKSKKVALVMSGGVVKAAAWHLGVALAIEELGFTLKNNTSEASSLEIGTYVGSSAGALISLYFASGLRPMDIIESHLGAKGAKVRPINYKDMLSLKKPMKSPVRGGFYDPFDEFPAIIKGFLGPFLRFNGLFSTSGLNKYITDEIILSNDFKDYLADLFIVATQLDHSRKCIFSKYKYPSPHHDSTASYYTDIPVSDSVAASMSVPPFYSPYPIKNPVTNQVDYYIDGEIRETLSTHVAVDNRCDFIISSWTHTPYHYHDEIGSLVNYGLPAISTQAIYLMIQKKIVESRARKANNVDIINTVNDYMKSNKFSNEHRKKLVSILERKLNHNPNIHFIDIYPKHENYRLFFQNSFSLNPDKMSRLVTLGYKRTMEVFRNHEWES
ncbi:patatin-like phospholipase family protein [Bacteriovoracaceae bacterium]|nr:patatin-like phospholipase family protein [Bacteriovoracaceae bacterium]